MRLTEDPLLLDPDPHPPHDARPGQGEPKERRKPSRPRPTRLVVRHRCVRCGHPIVLEARQMDIWCRPVAPTYAPFPQVLQRDCECGGHANAHTALLTFDPDPPEQLPR